MDFELMNQLEEIALGNYSSRLADLLFGPPAKLASPRYIGRVRLHVASLNPRPASES
jgi:hypothetical protein